MSGPSGAYGHHRHLYAPRLLHLSTSSASLIIGVGIGVLMVLVSTDVVLYQSQQADIHVTAVEWFIPGSVLATTSGFSMHKTERVTVTLTCSTVCFRFSGATVESPFTLEAFSVVYDPIQYVNATVLAPGNSYTGPIAVDLVEG
jgi:hypothetical protein